jgi:topoisomerase-4 subunit B
VRDYGRGIPLGKVVDVVSKMNTGGKYDSLAFKKSVGLNGVEQKQSMRYQLFSSGVGS